MRWMSLLSLLLAGRAVAAPPSPAGPDPDLPPGIPAAIKDEVRRTYQVLLDGDRAYLASTAGVVVADVKDPERPRYLGGLMLAGSVNQLALAARTTLVVAGGPGGVVIVDVADPARPRRLASLALPGAAMAVAVAPGGKLLAVAAGSAGLLLVDLAQPARPRLVAQADTPGYARDVLVRGDRAWLADGAGGVRGYRLAGSTIAELARWPSKGHVYQLALAGDLLYVAEGTAGLAILDVKAQPRLIGRAAARDTARGVAVLGQRAALADGTAGLALLDVAQPRAPRELGRHKPERSVNRVALRGELAYVANDYDGLLILRLPARGDPARVASLPAPPPPKKKTGR